MIPGFQVIFIELWIVGELVPGQDALGKTGFVGKLPKGQGQQASGGDPFHEPFDQRPPASGAGHVVHDAEDSDEIEACIRELIGRRVFDEIPTGEVKRVGGCWSVLSGELKQGVAGIESCVVKGGAEFAAQEMGKTPVAATEVEDTQRSVLL